MSEAAGKSASAGGRPEEGVGARIGGYHLLERIGEGGFGVVYAAEQVEPVRRRVALKVIKAGMDSEQVVARFEAERQALAVMDHPCIAKVFDGGVTPAEMGARPYFVMELVKGEPITDFCDKNRLSVRERCELMIKVCNAVQHAHTKGVVHRDLKPSNILVAYDADGGASPKVIDFGIAKALNQRLSEKTIFTERGKIIGTPEYMSPEQAEMSGLDIDTRSDVYSLGVVLYALLTGSLPFASEKLRDAAYAELIRIIKEDEPEKPSTRVLSQVRGESSLSAGSGVVRARHTDAKSLTSTLRRDLDWVVMTCLEKDRARRYETARELGEDLRRYSIGQPVSVGRPSRWYRVERFRARHLVVIRVTTLVFCGLLFVIGLLMVQVAYVQLHLWGALLAVETVEITPAPWPEGESRTVAQMLQDKRSSISVAERAQFMLATKPHSIQAFESTIGYAMLLLQFALVVSGAAIHGFGYGLVSLFRHRAWATSIGCLLAVTGGVLIGDGASTMGRTGLTWAAVWAVSLLAIAWLCAEREIKWTRLILTFAAAGFGILGGLLAEMFGISVSDSVTKAATFDGVEMTSRFFLQIMRD